MTTSTRDDTTVAVEVWADVLCPWSYIAKRRLEAALAARAPHVPVTVAWRAWEMDPDQRVEPGPTTVEQQMGYGRDRAAIVARFRHIVELGRGEGLVLNLFDARPVNSFDAHRLLVHAGDHGLREQMLERLLHAYHTDNQNIADRAVLCALAGEAGLDRAQARAVLDDGGCGEQVRTEERRGVSLGVAGVPTFAVDGELAGVGALPVQALVRLLERGR